ncbi:hypothetical protein DV20_13305 [Amycolatopsis rifamycinica]|uniref:Histidine kinase/HSP90-like ATPase domain-containing protein n=1 Tax=Amycolatopsis rifamycinica TaxID=287986 RepID=A0A066U463_9PSEU|nr:hypothetical protein DV20_13305 [Amycolatopsis rifamycinica]
MTAFVRTAGDRRRTRRDRQPRAARRAVTDFDKTGLPAAEIDDLVLAVSEVVDNALRYGRSPVRMRI